MTVHLTFSPTGTADAYWICGEDLYPITESHVRAIIDRPDLFGLSSQIVDQTYQRHGEKIGTEGNARAELIVRVNRNGWIRVRHYYRPIDYWSIQIDDLAKRKEQILRFLDKAIAERTMSEWDTVRIACNESGECVGVTFQDGGASRLRQRLAEEP